MISINYKLLFDGDISNVNLNELIAKNRNLPSDWCTRKFTEYPGWDFIGFDSALNIFLHHLKLAENRETDSFKQKFQIIVDSDLDGICSAAIIYKFLEKFYPNVETVYSIHSGKQHGLSNDIAIDKDVTLVILPDAGSNDSRQCKALRSKYIDVICLDHHIIEEINPYASIVNCMDGKYPNQNLCGAAVTWAFLMGFCYNVHGIGTEYQSFLLNLIDLVAVATISDVMDVTNEDNMYFVQNGLQNIKSKALCAFLRDAEVNLNDVTVEDIKFKVAPFVSAMIRMGDMSEKELLFRAFIDDYEEFDYEKRGSLGVETEDIYNRVVRLCKNAKGRQDRAKQKLLEECQIHEYPCILLVEYDADKPSTLTGLVANELANTYCKPCIVYKQSPPNIGSPDDSTEYAGSIRNYDGSPIYSLKEILEYAFKDQCCVRGHDNASGIVFNDLTPDEIADKFTSVLYNSESSFYDRESDAHDVSIGDKLYTVDFQINADYVDVGLIKKLHSFEHYSGYGFAPVSALVTNIKVCSENFKTMGKNTFNWKVYDEDNNVSYVKFKIDRENDALVRKLDEFDIGATTHDNYGYVINAICTFGFNVYRGEIYVQAIVKDYMLVDTFDKEIEYNDDFDLDLLI